MQGSRVTRSRIIRSAATLFAGSSLLACGPAARTPAGSGPGPAPGTRPVTLQVDNNWVQPGRVDIVQAWLARANRVYPNVKTELTDLASSGDKVLAAFAADAQGELVQLDQFYVQRFGAKGLFDDIDPVLKALRFDADSVYDIQNITHYGGKRHGMLIQLNSWVWVYNKTLFQQNGVAEPSARGTWKDHLEAAQRLAAPGEGRWGMQLVGDNPFQWFWQAGAEYVARDGKSSLFTSDECARVVQWLVDVAQHAHAAPTFSENKAQQPKFVNGVMATDQLSAPGRPLTKAIDRRFEWEVMPTPRHPTSGKPAQMLVTGHQYLVTKKASEHGALHEAVRVLVELYDKEVQQLYNDGGRDPGSLPVLKSVATDPAALAPPPQNLKVVVDQIATGRNHDLALPGAGFIEFRKAVWTELYAALDGKQSAEQAVVNMKRVCDQVLSDPSTSIPDPR